MLIERFIQRRLCFVLSRKLAGHPCYFFNAFFLRPIAAACSFNVETGLGENDVNKSLEGWA
jgi:hypothetical protein